MNLSRCQVAAAAASFAIASAALTPVTASAFAAPQPLPTIKSIHADPIGRDTRAKLNEEYVVIVNRGARAHALAGWTLRDKAHHVYRFPAGFRLASGTKVRVHTGSGMNRPHNLYWGSDVYIWNNRSDTAKLKNRAGVVVARYSYCVRTAC